MRFVCAVCMVGVLVVAAHGCGSADDTTQANRAEAKREVVRERAAARHQARTQARQRHRAEARRQRARAARQAAAAEARAEAERAAARAEEVEREEAEAEEEASECDPNYAGACLDPYASDYDCADGSGDGPEYTGTVSVVGEDHYGLDADGDGTGCELG